MWRRWTGGPENFCFFNDTATTEIYTLSLHDALPIYQVGIAQFVEKIGRPEGFALVSGHGRGVKDALADRGLEPSALPLQRDRKSTRLNSSHSPTSYAVFCLK